MKGARNPPLRRRIGQEKGRPKKKGKKKKRKREREKRNGKKKMPNTELI